MKDSVLALQKEGVFDTKNAPPILLMSFKFHKLQSITILKENNEHSSI